MAAKPRPLRSSPESTKRFPQLRPRALDLVAKLVYRDAQASERLGGRALHAVVGGDGDIVSGCVFGGEALDDRVCGLPRLGIENRDAAGLAVARGLRSPSIEDNRHRPIRRILQSGENFHQPPTGRAGIAGMGGRQLGPREQRAVSIHNQDFASHRIAVCRQRNPGSAQRQGCVAGGF